MCGRYAFFLNPPEPADAFPEYTFPAQIAPRYNIAPTQPILVLPNDGTNKADFFVWGLIPSWAKDPSIGSRLINARSETLAEKPAFRSAYKYRRCLVFANGFYEWQPGGLMPPERHADGTKPSAQARPGTKTKVPHFIRLKTGEPFAFAGLWEHWQTADGSEVRSAAIITTEPNELMSPIHNRMPVILPRNAYAQWIDPTPHFPVDLNSLLVPYPAGEMEAYPVSTLVNSTANDRPEIIVKV
ncbi:MAG: SOS response-associated peptidase [Chloroflexi bacterium]|nr:SOS response-associated peptidase [Chloroflexota bacterium]